LNLVAGSLTVPNIESRCNQLKLGHPLKPGAPRLTTGLPTIHSEQLNWSCYARNAKSPNFHKRFNQERAI
jgi:hypothetical protein